jgi:uncharacterized DUF497 family protein
MYIYSAMIVEWDPAKALSNLRKHWVDFADAVIALEDMDALTIEDTTGQEQRFKTLGLGTTLRVLLVIHVAKGHDTIRIISARKADRSENRQYWKGIKR